MWIYRVFFALLYVLFSSVAFAQQRGANRLTLGNLKSVNKMTIRRFSRRPATPKNLAFEIEYVSYRGNKQITNTSSMYYLYDRGRIVSREKRPAILYGDPFVEKDGIAIGDIPQVGMVLADDIIRVAVKRYDLTYPFIVWYYDSKKKSAYPSLNSIAVHLLFMMNRSGEQIVRKRYNLPHTFLTDRLPLTQAQQRDAMVYVDVFGDSGYFLGNNPLYPLWRNRFTPRYQIGNEKVAGTLCNVYRFPYSFNEVKTVWIDPKTNIVLRYEQQDNGNPAQRIPPKATVGMIARRYKVYPSLPASRFQLPPGTTAYLPEILYNVKLPAGVKRAHMTGPRARTGFDFEGALAEYNEDNARVNGGGVRVKKE